MKDKMVNDEDTTYNGKWQARTSEEYSFGSSRCQALPFYTGLQYVPGNMQNQKNTQNKVTEVK